MPRGRIGIAGARGPVEHRLGPATTFGRVLNKTELPAHRVCVGRRFVELGPAAEER
jgi:hypothetical protein